MNNVKILTLKLLRSYATKFVSESAGIRGKLKLAQTDGSNTDLEDINQEDVDLYESSFGEIAESYVNHKRKTEKTRERLKQNIVKSKYFKEKEPRFLTYVEKDQIKKLHKSDPEEWTTQRLSESFPALPETIRKLLRANWVPNSVESILKYDSRVVENWKHFKTGQLPVSPKLREHLMKFKDRKISLTDRETLVENFVRREIDLPKPKSSFFLNIIHDSSQEDQLTKEKLLASPANNSVNRDNRNFRSWQEKPEELVKKSNNHFHNREIQRAERHNTEPERLVFHEFLKKKLNHLDKTTPAERETLLDTYRKHINCNSVENLANNALESTMNDPIIQEKSVGLETKQAPKSALIIEKYEQKPQVTNATCTKHTSLDTYVKGRNLHMETNVHYSKPIKIPKNVYKKGMSYRISDCYYDDDGKFLYRVPGLIS